MPTMIVKWFDVKKGFGFIHDPEKPDDRDVFVHFTGVVTGEPLFTGDVVRFETKESAKGIEAFNVEVVEYATDRPHFDKQTYKEAPTADRGRGDRRTRKLIIEVNLNDLVGLSEEDVEKAVNERIDQAFEVFLGGVMTSLKEMESEKGEGQ